MLQIKLKGITDPATMSQIIWLQTAPTPDPRVWVKRSNSILSEQCYVAYQIKGHDECIDTVANVLPADPPPIPPRP